MVWILLGWLRRIPPAVWLALGLIAVLWFGAIHERRVGAAGVQKQWDAQKAKDRAVIDAAVMAARAAESREAGAIAKATDTLKTENDHATLRLNRTIADLRAGKFRVREHFTCPAGVSPAAAGASGGDAAGEGGLSDKDAEFLVRFAGDADNAATRLTACQAILAAERQ